MRSPTEPASAPDTNTVSAERASGHLAEPSLALRLGWRSLLALVGVGLAEAATLTGSVLLIGALVDEVIMARGTSPRFQQLLLATLGVGLLAGLSRAAEFAATEAVGYRYVQRLRMVLYAHLQRVPPRRLQNNSRGAILLRFTGDLSMLRTWISRGIGRGLVGALTLALGIAVLASVSVPMAVAVMGVLVVGSALTLAGGRHLRRAAQAVRLRRANLTTNVTEQIHSMPVIQAFGRSAGEYDRLARQNERLTDNLVRFARVRGYLRGLAALTGWVATATALAVGALAVAGGSATVGQLVTAVLIVRYLMRPVRTLGLAHDYWQSAKVSREKVLAFLNRTYPESGGEPTKSLRVRGGEIAFEGVHVKDSLHGLTGTVPAGKVVAVMGANGAGKSSLLMLVARLAEAEAGSVSVDGQNLAQTSLRSCARQIAMVSEALPLLRGSLRRNIAYRWREAPDAEIERVVDLCGLREFVASQRHGLDSEVNEGGGNLATGHAARIRLARALVANPKILLLDEPSANLDPPSKRLFREIILRYHGTVLWVTHDEGDAAIADEVWTLERGKLAGVVTGSEYRGLTMTSDPLPAWARA